MIAKFSVSLQMALACLPAILCATSAVLGQALDNHGTRYLQSSWTTENGLPQSSITAIVQTCDGYLWLGTFGGLVRFDGLKFTVFDTGTAPGLGSNRIISLFEDRAGNLWIGTENGGLTRYAKGVFTTFTAKDVLPDGWIRSMSDDRDGNLWVCTPKGVSRLSQGRFISYPINIPDAGMVREFLGGRDGRFWLAVGRTLSRFENGRMDSFTIPADFPSIQGLTLHEARDGSLWVSSLGSLIRFHEGVFTLMAVYPASEPKHDERVVRIFEDSAGAIGLLTARGVIRFRDGRLSPVDVIGGVGKLAAGFDLRGAMEDREGNLWIGGIGLGLHRFKPAQVIAYTSGQGLADFAFVPIAAARDGGLWLGGEAGSIFHFQPGEERPTARGTVQSGTFSRLSFSVEPGHLTGLRALYEDHTGTLWAGTYSGLMRIKDGQAKGWNRLNSILTGVPVAAIYEDRAGNLWIGAGREDGEGGLFRFENDSFTAYRTTEGLVFNDVRCIVEDRDGALWIGGVGGMSRFREGKFTNYTTEDGLSHNYVRAIHQTPDGALWIGTYGGGLNRFRGGRFTHITTREGLFDNIVSRILEDDRGNFWMSCNRGIFRASLKELSEVADGKSASVSCIAYNAADGMASSETNGGGQPAGWKDRDGRLWFPTEKGVVAVDPHRINPLAPPVAIERLLVDAAPLDLYAPAAAPPGNGDLEIHYTGLSFTAPEKIRFKYQLEGYDKAWIDAGMRRVAYYTKIPPGQYRFRVIAANNDGVWNETGAAIEFSLRPHFYQTRWFYALCAAGLVLLGWAAYRVRVRHLHQARDRLELKVKERTEELRASNDQLQQANEQMAGLNEQLGQANDNMLSVLDQLQTGVAMVDGGGRVTFLSQAAERLLGARQEVALGQPWTQLFPLPDPDKMQLKASFALPPRQRAKLPVQVQAEGGHRYWMEIVAQDDPRDARSKIIFLYDVSEIYDLRNLLGEKAKFHDLIGESAAMKLVYKQIQDVARMDTTVLIEGETGTGKELVARAIHYSSPRKDRPFLAVNCAGLTESLLASQLFGHKRGAFTGAVADQLGLFETAQGGTILLDEIGDIPLNIQTSLLRVLQEKEITRLGESTPRKIDVRVIAATHRDLNQAVASGSFRQDLLYRIRVGQIELPPLRRRLEDLPLLVSWFLSGFRATSGKPLQEVSSEAMELLLEYSWPGNVRELRSAIEYAVINCRGSVIQASDLPASVLGSSRPVPRVDGGEQAERRRILEALERSGGNRAQAARRLGIGRTTLYRRLKELGIADE